MCLYIINPGELARLSAVGGTIFNIDRSTHELLFYLKLIKWKKTNSFFRFVFQVADVNSRPKKNPSPQEPRKFLLPFRIVLN